DTHRLSSEQIAFLEREGAGEGATVGQLGPEFGVTLLHPDAARTGEIAFEPHRHRSDALLQDDFAAASREATLAGKHPGRTHRRVAGEGQLARRGEDA